MLAFSLSATWSDGRQTQLAVEVGPALRASAGEYRCPVAVRPDFGRLEPIRGVNAEQALRLGMNLCSTLVGSYALKGARVLFADGREFDGALG